MRTLPIAAIAAIGLFTSAALVAQAGAPATPGAADPARVTGGTYAVDPGHTQVLFAYNHMGITNNVGVIAMPTGSLTLDPKKPADAKVSISFPVANIRTGIAKLDEHLMSAQFFDAAKFPNATFESTSVKIDGTDADITGNLTIHGVTKPVTLDASFVGAGTNPMSKKEMIGFSATAAIKRSDFGLGMAVPMVGDAVELKIVAEFDK
ncbi:YceI family protein [Sphingobium subterraneum]|uniref:Polyisoprenoid-binding protein YceI n=1 Tax=Sphingobium subterraneum TaxID=627688 RepID=A0A841J8G1_9SPHN|nr:YceI family protein [Sphingobium subterraneum]MBB6124805.1 polyisoprenoid-binding protein YceI [Sphingobium subterraneum]